MENCARRLAGGEVEETIMSATGSSATPDVPSKFHTAVEDFISSSLDEIAIDDGSGARSSVDPKSEYFSARVEEMMRSKSQFSSAVEHEIEHSKPHWSQLRRHTNSTEGSGLSKFAEGSGLSDFAEGSGLSDSAEGSGLPSDNKEVERENEEVFAELMNDPQWKQHEFGNFFLDLEPLWKLGSKIGEGGQAEIYEVITIADGKVDSKFLLKVFKKGERLSDLRAQWPCGILRREVLCLAMFGFKLNDGRFGFGMLRCWGDLRKLIDQAMQNQAMQKKNNQGPPFPYEWSGVIWHAKHVMLRIAVHMKKLHKKGIIHRDLKAANILFYTNGNTLDPKTTTYTQMLSDRSIFVANFECSIGVVGTGFWRAPEILLALKNRSVIDFSKKVDVYSYAMTCFEIVTGRFPFAGELEAGRASNDLIIGGHRPKLPSDLDVTLKDLIERCWSGDPNERPSFSEIYEVLAP